MPRALAIETSGRLGSLALVEGGRVLAEDTFPHGLKHAAAIVVRVDALCRTQGWVPGVLRELYVSVGPGSFTGLRIGITMAKALAFATGARLVAVPSVEVLAHNAPPEAERVIIVLDAKREQIFTARLARAADGGWNVEEPAHLDSLAAMLARSPRPVHLIGDGIPYHLKSTPAEDTGVLATHEDLWRARASAVARLGYALAQAGAFTEPDALVPIYVRKPEAEEKYEQTFAGKGRPGVTN